MRVPVTILRDLLTFAGFMSLYASQALIQYFPTARIVLLLVFLCGMALYIFFYLEEEKKLTFFVLCFACCALASIGSLIGVAHPMLNISLVYFYFSIVFGFVFACNYDLFVRLLKSFLVLNFFVMIYEFYSLSFLLEPTSDLPQFIGRAKGLISYSKEAGALVLVFSVFFVRELEYRWFPILLVSAVLTGSRLSMVVVLLIIFLELIRRLFHQRRAFVSNLFSIFVLILVFIVGVLFYLSLGQSEIIVNRIYRTFDVTHSSNVERMHFWAAYLAVYSEFDLVNLIFGRPYFAQNVMGNGAESAFLNLLTDGGLVGLTVYLFAILFICFCAPLKFSFMCNICLLLASMQFSRVGLGFLDGVILWVIFWVMIFDSRKKFMAEKFAKMR